MSKVLLVDTNFSSLPIYQSLVKHGYEVIIVGNNPNDCLAKTKRPYLNIDYSHIDEMSQIVSSLGIEFVIPGCNDLSYKVCSQLTDNGANRFLDSLENAEILNNKSKFKFFATSMGIPVPRLIPYEAACEVNKDIIVKPVDAYSGRGITVIKKEDLSKLSAAIEKAKAFSSSNQFIVEEFVSGQLFSHSAFIKNGKVATDFIVQEYCTANPFVVDTSFVVKDFDHSILSQVREAIETIVEKLSLKDGMIHSQLIISGNSFWLIEVTRRCPGDLYSRLVERSTGFPYAEIYGNFLLGNEDLPSLTQRTCVKILRHTISLKTGTIFNSLQFHCPVQIEELIPLSSTGDNLQPSPFGRIGLMFLKADSESSFTRLLSATLSRKLYGVE